MEQEKVFAMSLAKVYPCLKNKVERKGRSEEELRAIIQWMTGYDSVQLEDCLNREISYQDFFAQAPAMNPNRFLIHGSICGIKIDEIEHPLMKEIRYLDKLVDELAKGKSLEKIFRK